MTSLLLEQYSLIGMAVRSFILLTLAAGIAFAFRRRSAAFVHGIWAIGLVVCLATPLVMLLLPAWTLQVLPPETVASPAVLPATAFPTSGLPTAERPATAAISQTPVLREAPTSFESAPSARQPTALPTAARPQPQSASVFEWPTLKSSLPAIWGIGLAVVLLRLLIQMFAVRHRIRQASELTDTNWQHQRDAAAKLLGLRTRVTLKRHDDAISPMVAGLFRPVVLVPADAGTWSRDQQHLVLLHELAHVQRRDMLTQLMATLACAVYWFNPMAWWAAAQMMRLREIACDDAVVTHSKVPTTYAQTLLDVAVRYRCRPTSAVAMARSSSVEGRISAILSSTRNRAKLSARSLRTLSVAAMMIVAVVGTCQLISRAAEKTEQERKPAAAVETPDVEKTMLVRVVDRSGNPLPDARIHVSIWEMRGAKRKYPNKDYTTDKEGLVKVARPERLQIMRMWPAKEGYVPQFINFARGSHEEGRLIPDEYEFRLQKGHRLSGRVVDDFGKPISNAKVQVKVDVDERSWGTQSSPIISTWLTDRDFNSPPPVTDSEGRWSIPNAPAPPEGGKKDYQFHLQVTHPDYAGDTRWGELQQQQNITTQDLRSGDATLILRQGLTFSGRITDPDGEPVTKGLVIWNADPYTADGVNETQIDDSGHYESKRLAAGEYPITVLAPGFSPWQKTVDLSQGLGDLDIQLEPGHSLQIEFVDTAGNPVPKVHVGITAWRGTEAIYNHIHSNVPNSRVPRRADEDGVYEWNWAPNDAVGYYFSAEGYAEKKATLVANSQGHVVTLAAHREVVGMATDTTTGQPIENFSAMPVIVFRPDHYHTRTRDAKTGQNGSYKVPLTGSARLDVRYRVRFEADGYRTVVSDKSFGPLDGRAKLDIQLQPAPARRGYVVDPSGNRVEKALVVEGSPTDVPQTSNGSPETFDSRPIRTDSKGRFQLHATTEPVRVRAYHELGYAEKALSPDEDQIGEMKLKPWSTISGRLVQAGSPVAGQRVRFQPTIRRGLKEARFQDSFGTQTDGNGYFKLDRIPPVSGSVKANLGPWRDSPLASSESIPLTAVPGEHHEIVLGGDGATITGQVVATGRPNDELSKQWSLNYLVSRDHGIALPEEASPLSFDASGPLQPSWLRQPDFRSWMATRLHYFVKLADDGQFTVHGVEPGEYDLVIQLYEQPAGCLVETIGEQVVPVTVTPEDAATGQLKIGDIEVQCRIGPRVGSDMRVFEFTDASDRVRRVDDLQGRHVLIHAWATWCAPCIASMPTLKATVDEFADSPLTVVGLNVDENTAAAQAMAKSLEMDWAQNYLGTESDLMKQLAIGSVPAYYLIGADGMLVGSANQWKDMEQLLRTEVK